MKKNTENIIIALFIGAVSLCLVIACILIIIGNSQMALGFAISALIITIIAIAIFMITHVLND